MNEKNPKVTVVNEALQRAQRRHAWAIAIIPALGFVTAMSLVPFWGINLWEIGLLVTMYVVSIVGIEVGFHRYFAHKTFSTRSFIQVILGIFGSMSAQGPLIYWAANHRRHHNYSDKQNDPHSPYVHKTRFRNKLVGLWHAHMGWIFNHETPNTVRFAKDLLQDHMIRKMSQFYYLWVLLGLLIPAFLGWGLMGNWEGAFRGLLWGGLVRIFLGLQISFSINSISHFFGRRPFDTADGSVNNIWLAIPSFGQSWHNNHHAFPSSPKTGFKWWQIDLGGWIISALEILGLAWDLKIPTQRMIEEKRAY